jgi:hypothetical protein
MAKPLFKTKSRLTAEKPRNVGEIRQSQLIYTFGIGSIVDFSKDTVIIAGIDNWHNDPDNELKIYNEKLQNIAGVEFFLPPKSTQIINTKYYIKDTPSYIFPEFYYCTKCFNLYHYSKILHKDFKCPSCKIYLVPSRFVILCDNGHIDDFPFNWWVHSGLECSKTTDPVIKMFNIQGRSDINSLWLKCTSCGKTRPLSGAFSESPFSGTVCLKCSSNHPHLPSKKIKGETILCNSPLKTRLRSSSGVYFPTTLSALSIPPWSKKAVQFIERNYNEICYMGSRVDEYLKSKETKSMTFEQLKNAFHIVSEQKNRNIAHTVENIYSDEYNVLISDYSDITYNSTNTLDLIYDTTDEFFASSGSIPNNFSKYFDKITIVDKLTVVQTLIGFTRLRPWGGDLNKDSDDYKRIAPLSETKKKWLPAVKLIGEGIFFKFKAETVRAWAEKIRGRYDKMEESLNSSFFTNLRFSPAYVALHSFAHLLIRQLSNDCGYSTASIREKIYCPFPDSVLTKDMYGVLIYLSSTDVDGSLGGLISIAQKPDQLRSILVNMLAKALWCSGDPLCIDSKSQGFMSLNYAACHDCILLPETSCEFHNILLDRASVVGYAENSLPGLMDNFIKRYL